MKSAGPLTISSGNITGLGSLSGTTIHNAADLSTGASVLRLEGNGYWVQGTLGIVGSGSDFELSGNPTGLPNTGYAFAPGTGTKAPRLLASGTGPKAPPIQSTTPTIIELVDWTNPSSPVVVGVATFKEVNRQDDWVFQDAEMAAEIGDVAIYQVDDTIKWTSPIAPRRFELGGLLLIASNYNTENGVTQLEQMLLSFKPYGRWATYPAMDTFVKANYPVLDSTTSPPTYGPCSNPDVADRTIPPPFKINLYTATGYNNGAANRVPLYTHEWKAFNDKPTLPINSPQLSEVQTTDEPSMPRFNCGMMLPWQNIRTRLSSKAGKYFPGVETYSYDHPTFGTHGGPSANSFHPLGAYRYGQADSMGHWFVLPPYPLKNDQNKDNAYLTAYESRPRDPTMFTNRDHYPWYRAMGYKYQPGSMSGHDWVTGLGGQRFDRSPSPSVLAIYAANQNWKRPEGNVPIRDLVEGWGMAYFNHSNHWVKDAKTFESLPKAGILKGAWEFVGAYYGSDVPYGKLGQPRGPQVAVDICGVLNGRARRPPNNDPEGYMYYSGWQRDCLHSYANAGWWAIMLNSPMHAIAVKHDFDTQWMSSLGSAPPTTDPTSYYSLRTHAWRVLSYVMAWKCATEHPLGYSREEIEARFQIELELIYDKIYKPAFIDNEKTIYSAAIRNLGSGVTPNINNVGAIYQTAGGSLGLYMVHTLTLMKQVGMWAAMRKRSYKCQAALDMMIRNLDRYVIDYVMDTDCRDAYYSMAIIGKASIDDYTVNDVPADWSAQKVMMDQYLPLISPSIDRVTAANYPAPQRFKGMFLAYDDRTEEQTGCPHLYMQYLKARRDYWPEYPNARLNSAIAKLQAAYDEYLVKRAANQAYPMSYLFPSHGPLLPPTEVGPKE
jgi:hypothetical protein